MGYNPTLLETIIIAFLAPIIVLIAQQYLKRILPTLAKLEVHLSDRLLLSFGDRSHTLVLYGSIYSKFGSSFVKKMTVTLYPEDTSDHFDFELDSIFLDLGQPPSPPVAFPVFERGGILLATFKHGKTFRNLATFKSDWHREIDIYSRQFTNGIDSTEFQTSYKSQQASVDLVKKTQDIFFWKEGKYKLELKIYKDIKKPPKIWFYEFELSYIDKELMRKNVELIATIYPSAYKGSPFFYNAYCDLKEASK